MLGINNMDMEVLLASKGMKDIKDMEVRGSIEDIVMVAMGMKDMMVMDMEVMPMVMVMAMNMGNVITRILYFKILSNKYLPT